MSYQLYGAPDSANIVVQMVLEQLGVRYELCWVDRSSAEQRSVHYRQNLNPQGLLPVLVDGETVLFETAAIALHLTDKHRMLAPQVPGSAARSRFLQWLFYLSNTLHADLRVQFYPRRHVEDAVALEALLAGTRRRVAGHFQLLEAQLSKQRGGPWFLGAELSILDFYLGALCRWSVLYPTGAALTAGRPASLPCLRGLLSELEQLPAVANTMAAQKVAAPFFTQPSPPDMPLEQICARVAEP